MSEGYWEVLRDGWIEEDCVSWLDCVILEREGMEEIQYYWAMK